MYNLYDVVTLKTDVPSANLKAGTLGTVLEIYPGAPPAYEVEFTGPQRTFTVAEDQLIPASAETEALPPAMSA